MITIRSLQHYMYCPRRWGLIEIEKKWEDNYFIIKSNIAHENVHQGVHGYKSASKYVCSNVTVYSDLYDLYGVVDCLEFIKTSDGTWIDFLKGCYFLNIVEYKPSMKKTIGDVNRFEDEMQVYAQKICIDEIYKTNCSADIYYTTERKRKKVDFENKEFLNNIHSELLKIRSEINLWKQQKNIPKAIKTNKCSGCSFFEFCLPKTKNDNTFKIIKELNPENLE